MCKLLLGRNIYSAAFEYSWRLCLLGCKVLDQKEFALSVITQLLLCPEFVTLLPQSKGFPAWICQAAFTQVYL